MDYTDRVGIVTGGTGALGQSVAREIRTSEATINCVAPNTIDTEANRRMISRVDPRRWVKPEDVAELIAYSCSEAGGAVNGSVIPNYGQL